jgi:hypothetical protein
MGQKVPLLYGGISGAKLLTDEFDFGANVRLRNTYAHLMAPHIMAFSPPRSSGGHHPAPWKPAKGGFAFDIHIEISVPVAIDALGKDFDAKETIWWIAALLRLAQVPQVLVPVISDRAFDIIANSPDEPTLQPFEITQRIFRPPDDSTPVLDLELLNWAKDKWLPAGRLLAENSRFYSALKAFDSATVRMKTSSSMLALWGAVEQLFSPSPTELRFRVSSLMASYLSPPGHKRLELYKKILKLYNDRSLAAHSAQEVDVGPLVETYVLLRNSLVRMVDEVKVPTHDDLEALLFQDSPP